MEDFLTGTTWKVPEGRYEGTFYVFTKGRMIERHSDQKVLGGTEKYKVIGDREIEYV